MNGNYAGVLEAIQVGANVSSVGPIYRFNAPSSPLIDCEYLKIYLIIKLKN